MTGAMKYRECDRRWEIPGKIGEKCYPPFMAPVVQTKKDDEGTKRWMCR